MPDKPIIMSDESVRAIMAGLKTQTRRVIKPQPLQGLGYMMGYEKRYVVQCGEDWPDDARDRVAIPYQPGDTLWVREKFFVTAVSWRECGVGYAANHPTGNLADGDGGYNFRAISDDLDEADRQLRWAEKHSGVDRWISPLFMPRWASRLSLLVTNVRCQRVQDISEEDAIAEGIEVDECHHVVRPDDTQNWGGAIAEFAHRWNKLNAKRGHPFSANDWVFAYTFEVKS